LEFPLNFLGVVMDIFSNYTISISWMLVNAIPLERIILSILITIVICHVCTTDRSLGGFFQLFPQVMFLKNGKDNYCGFSSCANNEILSKIRVAATAT